MVFNVHGFRKSNIDFLNQNLTMETTELTCPVSCNYHNYHKFDKACVVKLIRFCARAGTCI